MQDEKTSLMLGTIADVKKTIYDPCPYGYHMPPQDVWTNFTTITTAYNTGNVAGYNVVAADKYNQTSDVVGFTMENSRYGDVDSLQPVMQRLQMRLMWHSTRQPAVVVGMTIRQWRWVGVLRLVGLSVLCHIAAWGLFGHGLELGGPVNGAGRSGALPVRCVQD